MSQRLNRPLLAKLGLINSLNLTPSLKYLEAVQHSSKEIGVIERKGERYSYEEKTFAQGRDNTVQRLAENPDFAMPIELQNWAAIAEKSSSQA